MNHPKVSILKDGELTHWDAFVERHPLGSIYQTSNWMKIVQQTYHHRPLYLVIRDQSGAIAAGMPFFTVKSRVFGKRLSSVPCAQACNPLVSDRRDYQAFLAYTATYLQRRNLAYAELKTDAAFSNTLKLSNGAFSGYSTYVLDLQPEVGELERSFHKSCIRRAIKKSNKAGLELVIGDTIDDVKTFYTLYLKMRKEYGLLPQPLKFFATMWQILRPANAIDILHTRHRGEVISSILLLKYKQTATYEYGASRADKVHLKPSPFLLWEAIQRAKREGYQRFDFGRTEDDNEGLSTFKKRWNAERKPLHYYYLPEMNRFGALRQKGLAKQMMYYTIKYSPEPLCQFMGQVLYRNFV